MENKLIEINVDHKGGEVTIRQGEAMKLKEPVKVELTGSIGSVVEFLKKRLAAVNQGLAHILLNRARAAMSITLVLNETDPYSRGSVKGSLQLDPDFSEFGINTGKSRTPRELSDFFKMRRYCFEDSGEAMKIIADLKNIKAKINKQLEASSDNRANGRVLFEQAVDSNIPESFTLSLPIFKGEAPRKFKVEINLIARDADIDCALESVEANDILRVTGDQILEEQLNIIKGLAPDIVIIEV